LEDVFNIESISIIEISGLSFSSFLAMSSRSSLVGFSLLVPLNLIIFIYRHLNI